MTLTEYAYALRRRWAAVLAFVLVGAIVGFIVASVTPDQYKSTGSVLVASAHAANVSELSQGSVFVQNAVPSYVVLATSDTVLQPVIDELGLHATPASLRSSVTASAPLNTSVIDVSVVQPSADKAQVVAAAVLRSLQTAIADVSPRGTKDQAAVTVTTIQAANLPSVRFRPSRTLDIAIGFAIGLALGIIYALIRRSFGDRVNGARDVASITDAPLLGEIFEAKRRASLHSLVLHDPLSPEAESVRRLAANLNFLRVDGGLGSVIITSPGPAEGKSALALGLALAVAESGRRVLLIDADLRRPSIATETQLEGAIGLTNVLVDDLSLAEVVEQWASPNLTVLTAGMAPPNPSQLLSSRSMRDLMTASEREFDLVIVDSGPVLAVSETLWLSHAGSGVLMVTRWGRTTRRRLARATATLESAGSNVLGVVITRKPRRGIERYAYSTPVGDERTLPRRRRAQPGPADGMESNSPAAHVADR